MTLYILEKIVIFHRSHSILCVLRFHSLQP